MTWLKLSDTFDDDCSNADLSDAAFRTHTQGLLWAMRRETGGWLTDKAVRKFPDTDNPEAAIKELCDAGFWRREPGGYRVLHHMEWQPTPDDLAARREADAARQARARTKKAQTARDGAGDPSRRDSEPTTRVTTGRAGSGRGGPGREELPPTKVPSQAKPTTVILSSGRSALYSPGMEPGGWG